MTSQKIALLAIVGASLFWASANVVGKVLLDTFDPFPLAFLRFSVASLVILPYFVKEKIKNPSQLVKDMLPVALLSSANICLFYIGLQKTTSNASSIIYTASPLIVAALSPFVLREVLSVRKIAGITLGFIGVLIILIAPVMEQKQILSGDITGNFIILGAAFTWAFYTLGSRHLIHKKQYSPLAVSSSAIFVSTVVFGFLTVALPHRDFIVPLFTAKNFLLVLHLAIIVTVVTYLLYAWATKYATAATVSLTNYIQPVFSIFLGIVILGEPLTIGFIVGALLVFAGTLLATSTRLASLLRKPKDQW